MKERSILFRQPHADEMVRAILDGTKTQLRVPVKPQPPYDIEYPPEGRDGWFCSAVLGAKDYGHGLEWTVGASWGSQPCPKRWLHLLPKLAPPLGTVGDRLYVRETWRCRGGREYEYQKHQPSIMYHADAEPVEAICNEWRPSIHMPRWASRIDLEITRVWVERVQDITEEDAKNEGIQSVEVGDFYGWKNYQFKTAHPRHGSIITDEEHRIHAYQSPVVSFKSLWQSIYGTWDANPWVWAYEFRRVKS